MHVAVGSLLLSEIYVGVIVYMFSLTGGKAVYMIL